MRSSRRGSSVALVNSLMKAATASRSCGARKAPRPWGGALGRASGSPAPPPVTTGLRQRLKMSGAAPMVSRVPRPLLMRNMLQLEVP
jgi:hypothetical protein